MKNLIDINLPFNYYDIDSDAELEYEYDEKYYEFTKKEINELKIEVR